ncbi:MAG: hypothetical protein ACRDRO_24680, partial [Pseudonocardiaceae bacterium]
MQSTPWGTYARIADKLRQRLADVAPGSALPAATALAAEFGVRLSHRRHSGAVQQADPELDDGSRLHTSRERHIMG